MKILNEFKCTFPAVSENEAIARACLSAFLIQADPTIQDIADLRTVISEAVTNSIAHGYRNSEGEVSICLRLLPEKTVYIRVADKGCGIEDIEKAMQPLYTTAPEQEDHAGLGFAIMTEFMDTFHIRSSPEHGTVVTMRRKLGRTDNPQEESSDE
ncbi:MAG TPA: anti-sigma F factor [Ruminococcus sp.]|nr:anti-sigma F factor [Ruminococcus sp.]